MMAFYVKSEKRDFQYFRQLDDKAKVQYKEKLQILGGIEDPYVAGSSVAPESAIVWQDWSNVECTDIYNYLIATLSPYTREQLRAHKSMDGHLFVANGWVDVQVYPIPSRAATFWCMLAFGVLKGCRRLPQDPGLQLKRLDLCCVLIATA